MKFYVVNGSPRKNRNTAQLLTKSLEGINDTIKVELPDEKIKVKFFNLYKLKYTGCRSCFACKRINGKHYGHCNIKDDLKPILKGLESADGVVLGSPIYLSDVTGQMRSFYERFIFPYLVYDRGALSLASNMLPVGCIYTMNLTKQQYDESEVPMVLDLFENGIERIYGKPYSLKVFDTYQFKDYSKYKNEIFNPEHKIKRREEHFPIDLQNAYDLGRSLALDAMERKLNCNI